VVGPLLLDRFGRKQFDHGVVEPHPVSLGGVAELEHLEVGDPTGPGHEVGARLEPLDLLPEGEVRLLEHLIGIGTVHDERADEGIHPPLGGGEERHEFVVGERGHRLGRVFP
jgi:hypothetical protein